MKMNAEDWHDAADLIEQGAAMAESTSTETHTPQAISYVVKRLNALAMYATGKAMDYETPFNPKKASTNT